jgi:hypothetical protein
MPNALLGQFGIPSSLIGKDYRFHMSVAVLLETIWTIRSINAQLWPVDS